MLRVLGCIGLFLCLIGSALAVSVSSGAPDRFVLNDSVKGPDSIYRQTAGLAVRTQTINPAKKTLVLLVGTAQSQWGNVAPTLYTPTSYSAIDQFNIYDGQSYEPSGPLLGELYTPLVPYGPGNVMLRVADNFVLNAIFDRVIVVPYAIGQTTIADWTTGTLADRGPVAMRRLASKGITPATPGVTFGRIVGIGETDNGLGTTQAAFAAGLAADQANMVAAGFSGRTFVCKETWAGGIVSSTVQAAQVAAVNGTTIFSCGDLDSFNATFRNTDNLHWNDTGLTAVGNLVYNTMHASGAPF